MKKTLNENAVLNELSGNSSFFKGRRPVSKTTPSEKRSTEANGRPPERATARPGDRVITRHSFNFYEDQIRSLRQLVARKTLEGDSITLSDLVREALDDFLNKID